MGEQDSYIEMENPGELTGTIMAGDDVPYLLAGDVGYEITLTRDVPLRELTAAVGQTATVKVDHIFHAGEAAPHNIHIVVSKLSVHDPQSAS